MVFLESVQRFENALLEKVSASQGSSFIAHCDVPSEIEKAGQTELIEWIHGDLDNFKTLMGSFPCVCVRLVTTALSQSYGDEGDRAVYKHIAKRLKLIGEEIPPNERFSLFLKFRNSCEKIGLALPPDTRERYVDAYLFQAGVSRNQLPALAGAFLKAESILGRPSAYDTREIDDWEDRAVEFAPPGLTVLRRIVRGDPTGFYGATFIRLRGPQGSLASKFEREFQKAIQNPSTSASKGKKPVHLEPTLEFIDGDLWVTIPRHANRLEVKIYGKKHPLSRSGRLSLPMPWPSTIDWRRPAAAAKSWRSLSVFSDRRNILIFDGETGIYRGNLNPAKYSGQSVRAGQLWFLSPLLLSKSMGNRVTPWVPKVSFSSATSRKK